MNNSSLHNDDLIRSYLKGELTNEQRISFEKELKSSTELQAQVEDQQMIQEFLILKSMSETSDSLKEQAKKIKQKQKVKHYTLVTVGALLLTLGGTFFITNETDNRPIKNTEKLIYTGDSLSTNSKVIHQKSQQKDDRYKHDIGSTSPKKEELIIHIDTTTDELIDTVNIITDTVSTELSSHTIPEQQTKKETKKPCEHLSVLHETTPSCQDKATGTILFTTISGGKPPYSVVFNNKETTKSQFINLYADEYELILTDQLGCSTTHQLLIQEEYCEELIYSFNPQTEDYWELPNENNQNAKFVLYNKFGKLLVEQNLSDSENQWTGVTKTGDLITKGVYIFVITYQDGTMIKDELNIMW
jgi:hypothetical protein